MFTESKTTTAPSNTAGTSANIILVERWSGDVDLLQNVCMIAETLEMEMPANGCDTIDGNADAKTAGTDC